MILFGFKIHIYIEVITLYFSCFFLKLKVRIVVHPKTVEILCRVKDSIIGIAVQAIIIGLKINSQIIVVKIFRVQISSHSVSVFSGGFGKF
ncbi:hypothetical protein D3C71_2086570 [compost metagenome]